MPTKQNHITFSKEFQQELNSTDSIIPMIMTLMTLIGKECQGWNFVATAIGVLTEEDERSLVNTVASLIREKLITLQVADLEKLLEYDELWQLCSVKDPVKILKMFEPYVQRKISKTDNDTRKFNPTNMIQKIQSNDN